MLEELTCSMCVYISFPLFKLRQGGSIITNVGRLVGLSVKKNFGKEKKIKFL